MTERVPLALFTYNRPHHVRRALDALLANRRLEDVRLIIYGDAPKHAGHADGVSATRRLIAERAAELRAEVIERPENLGLARSIAGSVGDLTRAYGRVIVLEDDLVAAPDFLHFSLEGLERYADAENVLQISGCLLIDEVRSAADALFLPLTTTWGWSTWERAWRHFRWEGDVDASQLEADASLRARFTLDGAVDYASMLRDRIKGANDSWGVLWWYAVARANGLVLYPRRSLIWNGGFDSSGVHCGGAQEFEPEPPASFKSARLPLPLTFPTRIAADTAALARIRAQLAGGALGAPGALSDAVRKAKKAAVGLIGVGGRLMKPP